MLLQEHGTVADERNLSKSDTRHRAQATDCNGGEMGGARPFAYLERHAGSGWAQNGVCHGEVQRAPCVELERRRLRSLLQ